MTRQVAPSFIAALTSTNQTTSASAVAENSLSSGVCAPLQSFMSIRSRARNHKGNARYRHNVSVGTMIYLVNGAGAAGNWGLIQVPGDNGNPHNQTPFWADQPLLPVITDPQAPHARETSPSLRRTERTRASTVLLVREMNCCRRRGYRWFQVLRERFQLQSRRPNKGEMDNRRTRARRLNTPASPNSTRTITVTNATDIPDPPLAARCRATEPS